jgi:hypothetical protein
MMNRIDVTSRVLSVLQRRGACSFEDLLREVPQLDWVQLSLALDKLAREADIDVWRTESGDYRIIAHTSLPWSA